MFPQFPCSHVPNFVFETNHPGQNSSEIWMGDCAAAPLQGWNVNEGCMQCDAETNLLLKKRPLCQHWRGALSRAPCPLNNFSEKYWPGLAVSNLYLCVEAASRMRRGCVEATSRLRRSCVEAAAKLRRTRMAATSYDQRHDGSIWTQAWPFMAMTRGHQAMLISKIRVIRKSMTGNRLSCAKATGEHNNNPNNIGKVTFCVIKWTLYAGLLFGLLLLF